MPKFACNLCKEDYPDSQTLVQHFAKDHATTKCHLCKREAAKNGNFCPTCRSVFLPDIELFEHYESERAILKRRLDNIDKAKATQENILRGLFIQRKKEMFCAHEIPKTEKCERCEQFNNREVKKSVNIIRIKLDDFKAGTLKKPQIKIVL